MIVCDICKKEINDTYEKMRLPHKHENTTMQYKDMDICHGCQTELKRRVILAQYEFVKEGEKENEIL